jgi:hypothetical protein
LAPAAKTAPDFLADLGHSLFALGVIVVERDMKIVPAVQHHRLMLFRAQEQVADRIQAGLAAPADAAEGGVERSPV